MDSLIYERFIRKSCKCARFRKGADADIWEEMLICKRNYEKEKSTANTNEKEKKYNMIWAEVKMYINNAYNELIARIQSMKYVSCHLLAASKELQNLQLLAQKAKNSKGLFQIINQSLQIIIIYGL